YSGRIARDLTGGNRDNREFQFSLSPLFAPVQTSLTLRSIAQITFAASGHGANLRCAKPKEGPGCTIRSLLGPTPDTREESRSFPERRPRGRRPPPRLAVRSGIRSRSRPY